MLHALLTARNTSRARIIAPITSPCFVITQTIEIEMTKLNRTDMNAAIKTLNAATARHLVDVNRQYAGRDIANADELAWGRVLQDPATRDLARWVMDHASERTLVAKLGFKKSLI